MAAAGILFASRCATWSFINAMSGVITTQIPSMAMAGTWKQIDLPPPVGNNAKVSRPATTASTISSCNGRKDGYPQYCFNIDLVR